MPPTHEVFNQSTELADFNLFDSDQALRDAVRAFGAKLAEGELSALGEELGRAETFELGRLANEHEPTLKAFDRVGHRIDAVEFHASWHELMGKLIAHGAHSAPWAQDREADGAARALEARHTARAAKYLMFAQVENGTQCPVTMTYASVPVIAKQPGIAKVLMPKLLSREYDPRDLPINEKRGALIGMGLTEKQGGSDVRANTTFAEPDDSDAFGERYRITGHKWFLSAPMCDAFLVLAQTDRESASGLSCFFMPRWRADGERNAIAIQRLKDKLGNRSNASSEVEFRDAHGWLVGEVGRGVPTILEMGNLTRLDCAIGTAGMMRRASAIAIHHASQRKAFGRKLAEHPLMRNVLADLAIESEAATMLAMRLAHAIDEGDGGQALLRVGTPIAKYWVCKRGVALGFEAMEVLGGNGYVEEAPLARIYRELPVNSIWEGSGNVMCVDVLRALGRSSECRTALEAELTMATGKNRHYDAFVGTLVGRLADESVDEADARSLVEAFARALQGALLLRHSAREVAEAFCASRLAADAGNWGQTFGTLPGGCDAQAIVRRAGVG